MNVKSLFKLRKPCENCPFRKQGAIELRPGRLAGIIEDLQKDDYSVFQCHKTVHNERTGGEWVATEDEMRYIASGLESYCVGALIYLHKARTPNVAMRLGHALGVFNPDTLPLDDVIDPPAK